MNSFSRWMAWLALLLAACGKTLAPAASSDGYEPAAYQQWAEREGGNDHWYQAVAAPLGVNWQEATDYAADESGYLATIASSAENEFVFALVKEQKYWQPEQHNSAGPWLGAMQADGAPEPVGGWRWVHDEGALAFTNWLAREPNNSGPGSQENRIIYFGFGPGNPQPYWNDVHGARKFRGFIVEYDHAPAGMDASLRRTAWAVGAAAVFVLVSLLSLLSTRLRSGRT